MRKKDIARLLDVIIRNDNFIITTHLNHDPDAISSLISTAHLLSQFNKNFLIYFREKLDSKFSWIPYQSKFTTNLKNDFKNVIIVDCESYRRTGKIFAEWCSNKFKIIIDHHVTNRFDGEVNFVYPEYPSNSLILFKIIKELKIINSQIATVILLGLMGDTNYLTINLERKQISFVLRTLNELSRYGADFNLVNRSLNFKSWANFLKEIKTLAKARKIGDIIYLAVDEDKEENIGNIPNSLNFINEGKVIVVFRKNKKSIRLSFRSKDNIDVSYLAKTYFSGGGHRNASGGKIKMNLREAIPYVLRIVKSYLKEHC